MRWRTACLLTPKNLAALDTVNHSLPGCGSTDRQRRAARVTVVGLRQRFSPRPQHVVLSRRGDHEHPVNMVRTCNGCVRLMRVFSSTKGINGRRTPKTPPPYQKRRKTTVVVRWIYGGNYTGSSADLVR